jgi:hypothetical protein
MLNAGAARQDRLLSSHLAGSDGLPFTPRGEGLGREGGQMYKGKEAG